MSSPRDRTVEREYNRIAKDYARRGYRVTRPDAPGTVPDFLRNHQPDLIAERSDDRVVVEVKRTRSLRGSNDLLELAEEIAAHSGWRLELVALGREADEIDELADPNWLKAALRTSEQILDDPAARACLAVYQTQLLEALLHGLAVLNKLRPRGKSASRIASELAFHGVIDQETLSQADLALKWRYALVHGHALPRSTEEASASLTSLCRTLHLQLREEAALARET